MSDNILNTTGEMRAALDETITSDDDITDVEDLIDFPSGSSECYSPDRDYESDDSRTTSIPNKRARLDALPCPSATSTPARPRPIFQPTTSSPPLPNTVNDHDLSSEDEVDEVTAPSQQNPNLSLWVRVYNGEPEIDPSSDFIFRYPGP